MADRIKGITIEINGNTTKLQDSLKDVNKSIKNTQTQLKDVDKLLKLDPKNTELIAQKQQLLAEATGETKEKLDQLKRAQEQLSASGVDKTSAEYQALSREIIDCETSLKKLKEASKECNSVMQKIGEAGEKIKNAGGAITEVGKDVSKVSAVAAAGLGAAVKTTMDFDSQMSKVKAISGATDEQFQALRDKAREMGASTKFSATESAQAMEYMAMAGWKTDQMIDGLAGIMNLAAASGEDLATTSDIVTDALTAFGLEAGDAGHFADILAKASSSSNTNVSMMGETFKYAAPLFGSMGYSAEDAAIAIGLMANSGIKATNAGTALRGIITRMAKPTKESAIAMETLGLTLDDGEGNMLSFYDVMQQMRQGFGELKISEEELNQGLEDLETQFENGELTEKQYDAEIENLMTRAYGAEGAIKAEAAAMLAGKNALSGLLAIVNASDKDFDNLTEAVYNSKDTAQSMADTMQDNLGGELTILQSQLQELAISFGDIIVPKVRAFVEKLQELVDKFNGLDESQKKIITIIAVVVAVLGPLLIIIGSIITAIGNLIIFLPIIASTLAPVVTAIGGFVAANLGVIAVIGLVIAAVVTLIKHWDDIKTAAKLLAEIVGEKFNEIKGKAKSAFDDMKNSIKETFDNAVNTVKGGIDKIKGFFDNLKLKLPDIKLPHFSLEGDFDLKEGKLPKLGVEWYRKAYDEAYLLNSPTIFGASGGHLLGGGEGNGSEAIVGTNKLMSMISQAMSEQKVNVSVYLEGDASQVFKLNRQENNKFVRATGYKPLA